MASKAVLTSTALTEPSKSIPDPMDPVKLIYVKSNQGKPKVEEVPMVTSPITSPVVNGLSRMVIPVSPGVTNNNPPPVYFGTILQDGNKMNDKPPQKILLTQLRGKDGSLTKFILPRGISKGTPIKPKTVLTNSPKISSPQSSNSNSPVNVILAPHILTKPMSRGFVIHSNCEPNLKSPSILKHKNPVSTKSKLPVKSKMAETKVKSLDSDSTSISPPVSQLMPKPLPPATAPCSLPFPDTLPPAKTFEMKTNVPISSDVTITSVSLPTTMVTPVTPLLMACSPVGGDLPALIPFNNTSSTSSCSLTNNKEGVFLDGTNEVELIPKTKKTEDSVKSIINGYRLSTQEEDSANSNIPDTKIEEVDDSTLSENITPLPVSRGKTFKRKVNTYEKSIFESPVLLTSHETFKQEESPGKIKSPDEIKTGQNDGSVIEEVNEANNSVIKVEEEWKPKVEEEFKPKVEEELKPKVEEEESAPTTESNDNLIISSVVIKEEPEDLFESNNCNAGDEKESSEIKFDSEFGNVIPKTEVLSDDISMDSIVKKEENELNNDVSSSDRVSSPLLDVKLEEPCLDVPKDPVVANDTTLEEKGNENSTAVTDDDRKPEETSLLSSCPSGPPKPVVLGRSHATGIIQVPRVIGSYKSDRTKKRKSSLLKDSSCGKTIAVKRLELMPGAKEVDPVQVIEWDPELSIGKMPGSDIEFIINKYGVLQVFERSQHAKFGGSMFSNVWDRRSSDDIYRCVECQCYGLVAEFVDSKFCSRLCKDEHMTKKVLLKKRGSIQSDDENTRKKRKMLEVALAMKPQVQGSSLRESKSSELKDSAALECAEKSQPTPIVNSTAVSSEKKSLEVGTNDKHSDENHFISKNSTTTGKKNHLLQTKFATKKIFSKVVLRSERTLEKINPVQSDSSKKIGLMSKNLSSSVSDLGSKNSLSKVRKPSYWEINKLKCTEPMVPNEILKPAFNWSKYLENTFSSPAWARLFQNPFPPEPNMFNVGDRLEAIDPQRPSLFCVVSVAEIKGYRLRLHFDGYYGAYDFWENADSSNIFPCGFCEKRSIPLQTPPSSKKEPFHWSSYLNYVKAKAAPAKCFTFLDSHIPNLFKKGMKLEAVDRKNSSLICVATVAAVLDHRILVHFDSWDEVYDYWADVSSPSIHPVGWCSTNQHPLTPPNGWRKKNFSWNRYLDETGSEAAPMRAFLTRPSVKFRRGTKLEAVDIRVPHILRVATIKQVLPYQVFVAYDGFPPHFGSWFDDDSPDLHPVGWSRHTNHPLAPPPSPDDTSKCLTVGCLGVGNARDISLQSHSSIVECPYSIENLEADLMPDRLSTSPDSNEKRSGTKGIEKPLLRKKVKDSSINYHSNTSSDILTRSCSLNKVNLSDIPSYRSNHTSMKTDKTADKVYGPKRMDMKIEPYLLHTRVENVLLWDSAQVSAHARRVTGASSNAFNDNMIDGEAFLMLEEDEIIRLLHYPKITASKLFASICYFRSQVF